MKNQTPYPPESKVEKPRDAESWRTENVWTEFADLKAEKNLKLRLKSVDPGAQDFSQDFFNNLHDKVMAQVEQSEVLPKEELTWASLVSKAKLKLLVRSSSN